MDKTTYLALCATVARLYPLAVCEDFPEDVEEDEIERQLRAAWAHVRALVTAEDLDHVIDLATPEGVREAAESRCRNGVDRVVNVIISDAWFRARTPAN